jgi:hypothetical protein
MKEIQLFLYVESVRMKELQMYEEQTENIEKWIM